MVPIPAARRQPARYGRMNPIPSKARSTRLVSNALKHRAAFARIYEANEWGDGSGPGSRRASTKPYRQVLERILFNRRIRRVVDLGCGDWRFSRLVNWSGIEYLGIDVVPQVIKSDLAQYSSHNVHFRCADFRSRPLPDAELYILKDVLQHWPTGQILSFLKRMAGKQMLITNTVWHGALPVNTDISAGEYRPLDLLGHPFHLRNAKIVLEYFDGREDYKRVLLVNSPA